MPPNKQQKPVTTPEVRDALLDLIQRKFYEGHAVQFAKDRRRLIQWVVCYPAAWLYERGVSSGLPLDRYKEIMSRVLIEAASFAEPTKVTYLPAYLRQVIRSHFRHHGDEIYDEAKSVRNLVDQAMLLSGSVRVAADPVRELAQAAAAARLLTARKRPVKARITAQLDLL
jgi:hypothetical protein